MPASKHIQRLKVQNRNMAKELQEIKNSRQMEMENSLTSLVQGAFSQANITSFNPALQNNLYAPLTINWTMLTYMYKTHGILQTAIDVPVLDALRGGLDITSDELDSDDLSELHDFIEETGVIDALTEAAIWARLYGGGALIVNNGQDPATPLNFKNLKKLELYAANRWELYSIWKPGDYQTELNPWLWAAARESEFVYFYGQRIHTSRILTLSGKTAPYIIRWQLQGWGMSEYERMLLDFNKYIKTQDVTYDLLQEAKIDVYRFEGLKNQLISAAGTNQFQTRLNLMNASKNANNAVALDKNDEFEQKQITFAGLAEVMKDNRIGIASALRMPLSKIFGLSATGFSSGEDDIENYNAMVESEVRQKLRRPINKILKMLILAKFGVEASFKFGFHPLRVIGSVEEEAIKTSKQNRYLAEYDRGLINSQEMGQIAEKEKLNPIPTDMQKGLLDDHPAPAQGGEGGEDEGGDDDE